MVVNDDDALVGGWGSGLWRIECRGRRFHRLTKSSGDAILAGTTRLWQVADNPRATFGRRFDLEPRADRVCPVLHNMKTKSFAASGFSAKSDAIVSNAEHKIVFHAAHLQNNIAGLRVFVRVDERLAQNPVEL